jgi:hypothetical protein
MIGAADYAKGSSYLAVVDVAGPAAAAQKPYVDHRHRPLTARGDRCREFIGCFVSCGDPRLADDWRARCDPCV